MNLIRVVLVLATAVGVLASPAKGHLLAYRDGDVVKGRLDLRTVVMERGDKTLTVKLATQERFRQSDLSGEAFNVYVDSRGDRRWDFRLQVYLYEGVSPRCSIYDRNGFDRGGVEAKKEKRSVTCELSTADPFNATRHMRWRVETSSTDRAPDKGWFNH